jgi:hypothetical protein
MSYQSDNERKSFGEWFLEMMVRVFTIAAFLLLVTPLFIAPMLGVTPEEYAANEITWTLVSLALGYVAAYPFVKLAVRSIRKTSGGIG